jgi:hypothetical protein
MRGQADEAIAVPKGPGSPDRPGLFPCKLDTFVGSTKGAMMRFMDPFAARLWSAAAGLGAAVLGAPAMPPVVAVLLASAWPKGRRVHCCPQRAWTPDPSQLSPANEPFFGTAGRGHDRAFVDP